MTCPVLDTTLEQPVVTGYALQNPCCDLDSLQILYGMAINYGSSIPYGSTV